MTKTLTEQTTQAEYEFRQAHKRAPRARRTMRLHWQWVTLKAKLIAEEVRQEKRVHRTIAPASAPIGQETAECAA